MAKISPNISSNSLFHFVSRRDWLLQILKRNAFKARYVYEELPEINFRVGIPMKCFCDIPLGLIKKHMTRYGKYGIGVSKEYAKLNNLSPILYVHNKSDTLKRYLKSVKKTDFMKDSNSLLPYFKYDEIIYNDFPKNGIRIRYYDEREWRWIPNNPNYEDFEGFDEEEIRRSRLDLVNKVLETEKGRYLLEFDFEDITYIFVQKDEDVDRVIEEIQRSKIEENQKYRLVSKIITAKQIEWDF